MKKLVGIICLSLMCGCASSAAIQTAEPTKPTIVEKENSLVENTPAPTPEEVALQEPDASVDLDLTVLSSTMIYSEVFNMVNNPNEYKGKTIKIKGFFSYYYDENSGNEYYACVIPDATACCAQGIEFVPVEKINPEEFPEPDQQVTIVGVFDTYFEGDVEFNTLRNAQVSF